MTRKHCFILNLVTLTYQDKYKLIFTIKNVTTQKRWFF